MEKGSMIHFSWFSFECFVKRTTVKGNSLTNIGSRYDLTVSSTYDISALHDYQFCEFSSIKIWQSNKLKENTILLDFDRKNLH